MMAIIFDTETTGVSNPEIIESSWLEVAFEENNDGDGASLTFGVPVTQRFQPSSPITMGAMAIHHIMDEDLASCPPCSTFKLPGRIGYLIGHNVDYDWGVAGRPAGVKLIDTLCMARRLWPACDSHSLGALTYFLFRSTARSGLRSPSLRRGRCPANREPPLRHIGAASFPVQELRAALGVLGSGADPRSHAFWETQRRTYQGHPPRLPTVGASPGRHGSVHQESSF